MRTYGRTVWWYRQLVKLYPKAYREEYGAEMVTTFRIMLETANSETEQREIVVATCLDYVRTLFDQVVVAVSASFNRAPKPVKYSTIAGVSLIAPFFVVLIYNVVSLGIRHVVEPHVLQIEARLWPVYSMVLPLTAIVITATICFCRLYRPVLMRDWRQLRSALCGDWVFSGFGVAALALFALF